ncbi:MAG: hypothetical protein IKO42_08220 [Opitutales bacterium]|nr:hypothetical protein [Opitutales bacterium]
MASLFAAALLMAGCASVPQSVEQVAIDRVLKIDSTLAENSSSIAQVYSAVETVNLDAAPKKFKEAFKESISAWKSFADLEKKMYAADLEKAKADIKAFLGEYRSNPTQAIVDLKAQWPQFEKQLDDIYEKLRKAHTNYTVAATNYGVAYPDNSFWRNLF